MTTESIIPLSEAIERQLIDIRDTRYAKEELEVDPINMQPSVYVGNVDITTKILAAIEGVEIREAIEALEFAGMVVRNASGMETVRTDSNAMRRGLSQALAKYSGML